MVLQTAPPMLVVSEVASSTLVGDGPFAGHRCAMIRLGGCNLSCSWCDVPYSWDGGRFDIERTMPRRLVQNVVAEAMVDGPPLLLITGGEPLLQQRANGWPVMLAEILSYDVPIEAHTNGTVVPGQAALECIDRFVVSPKLSHSGEPTWVRINPDALRAWSEVALGGRVTFSFVVRDPMDVQTVDSLATVHSLPRELLWISPEGTTAVGVGRVTADIVQATVDHGFNLATRIPVLTTPISVPVG